MNDSIVVSFRSTEVRRHADEYLSGVRSLSGQAAAMGGRLASWGALVFSFEFSGDALEDAIELAISVALDSVPGHAFAIGLSEGKLARCEEVTTKMALAWGAPLVRAEMFARVAKAGEVLVDEKVGAVRRSEVLTLGARAVAQGQERARAFLLDLRHPWRSAVAESVASLERPRLVGRPELVGFLRARGPLGIVRADHGYGGTRFLSAIEDALSPVRVLRISPHPLGEPLGALRRAMLRAVTLGHAPLAFTAQLGQSLDGLLAGEGLDSESAAELLISWLRPDAPSESIGAVLVDDAEDVDADTLDVVARAARAEGGLRVIARLGLESALPPSFSELEITREAPLGGLLSTDAAVLAAGCTRGELDGPATEQWVARGGGSPLSVVETLYDGLEGGELVWEDGRATARVRGTEAIGARSAVFWISRRFAYLDPLPQAVLQALAVLGGEAELRDLQDLLRLHLDAAVDPAAARARLEAGGWVVRVRPDMMALASASHRNAVLAMLSDEVFSKWHAAACAVFERRSRPLAVASATVHALLAGDPVKGAELARRAAGASRAVGLEETATAFDHYAETRDPYRLIERGLLASQLDRAEWVSSEGSLGSADPETLAQNLSLPDDSVLPESIPPPADDEDRETPILAKFPPGVAVRRGNGSGGAGGVSEPARAISDLPPSAVTALRNGDVAAVERLAEHLRAETGRVDLANRLEAMVNLARGETGDALRRLREAAEAAKKSGSAEQCRASLALGVALAAANRIDEALLAVLDGLARARELADKRGEQACARFLAQLARGAGHPSIAAAWQALATR